MGGKNPVLVGTTGSLYQGTIIETAKIGSAIGRNDRQSKTPKRQQSQVDEESNYFKSAQWYLSLTSSSKRCQTKSWGRSPDGTTLLTSSADNALRSFVLPVDLLASNLGPHHLTPYASHSSPEPVYATAFHPLFSLQEPASCLVVASLRALPLRLISPFAPGILASYPFVSPTTEAYIAPHSLLFSLQDQNHLFAGSESCLSIFDVNRDGVGPISRMRTTPSRRHHIATSGDMKGIVSTMAMNDEGLLAAGTFTRWVGLYDGHGRGEAVGVFSVVGGKEKDEGTAGKGITQVLWSACGRYLCSIERASDGISVWDIRGTGKKLAWLRGRNARSQQRLGAAVMEGEIWAGGIDGKVRVWEGLGKAEGVIDPKWEFRAHDDAVTSTILHPTGSVVATCSGQRRSDMGLSLDIDNAVSDTDCNKTSSRSSNSARSSQTLLNHDLIHSSAHAFYNSMKTWAL